MATLHLVNASSGSSGLRDCLYAAASGDTVLLIENGVYCGVAATFARDVPRQMQLQWCALRDDVHSRGIEHSLASGVRLIDDGGFVDLVASHQPIVSWG